MSAIYRIEQDSVQGDWGVARLDLTLFPVGGTVSLEAQDQDLGNTYQWEIISEPYGSTAAASLTVPNPSTAPWLATFDINVTGGGLARLIFNAGRADQDIAILYFGVVLPNSGLCIPAFNETFFDNSSYSVDGYKGYERKLTAFLKWCDTHMFSRLIFDNRSSPYNTGSIAGSGGVHIHEFAVGPLIQSGGVQAINIIKTAGTAADIKVQFYDANPAGAGAIIYQVSTHDFEISALDDRNIWFMDLQAADSLWLRILNEGSTSATFDVRIRVKGD